MSQVSRPMQIALAAVLVFALAWFVALRPKTAEDVATAPEPTPAAQEAPAPAATKGEDDAAQPQRRAAAKGAAAGGRAGERPAATHVAEVRAALRARKALALAFVDPLTADARAVADELEHVSGFGGRALLLSIPIAELSAYGFITRGIEVTVAPTVVIVGPDRKATTIVGFADRGEIEQRLADALAS